MRRQNDLYLTGKKAVDELLARINLEGTIYECCNGTGNISKPLIDLGFLVIRNDIIFGKDATLDEAWEVNTDWVITNPPFSSAFKILQQAHRRKFKIAFLLRLSFLEPTYERQDFLYNNPPSKIIVLPRYSFTENGKTDSVTTFWGIWNYRDDNPIEVALK